MIAGFKTSPTQQAALNAINLADSRIKSAVVDTTEAEALLEQARQAYFNCKYEDAYNLAQEALRKLPIILPEVSIWVWVIVGALLMSGYYIYKHPKYLKFKKKKSK